MEIIITLAIVLLTSFIFYRSVKKRTSGGCDCGSCSSHCPMYEEREKSVKK